MSPPPIPHEQLVLCANCDHAIYHRGGDQDERFATAVRAHEERCLPALLHQVLAALARIEFAMTDLGRR